MERRNEEKFDQTIQQQIEEKEIQIDFIEQYAQPDFPEESWNANTQWMQILSIPERLVCLMAFANQVFPKVWDTFAEGAFLLGKDSLNDFGLVKIPNTEYTHATIDTALFLLGGQSSGERSFF